MRELWQTDSTNSLWVKTGENYSKAAKNCHRFSVPLWAGRGRVGLVLSWWQKEGRCFRDKQSKRSVSLPHTSCCNLWPDRDISDLLRFLSAVFRTLLNLASTKYIVQIKTWCTFPVMFVNYRNLIFHLFSVIVVSMLQLMESQWEAISHHSEQILGCQVVKNLVAAVSASAWLLRFLF